MDPVERTTIEQRLVETGEKERLKEHLRNRLIESGWREELKLEAKQVRTMLGVLFSTSASVISQVVDKKGLNNVTLEDLVKDITPKGRASVPDAVKKELLVKIQDFLSKQHNM